MNTYYFVRHGQDTDNAENRLNGHRDTSLSQNGLHQAQELAQKIHDLNINVDYVFVSPLSRARQTANIICDYNNFPTPTIQPLLIERDFGKAAGIFKKNIPQICPHHLTTPFSIYCLDPPQGETFLDVLHRATTLLQLLDLNFYDRQILLFSHGDFGKMLFATYYHLDWQEVLLTLNIGNCDLLTLSPHSTSSQAKIIEVRQYNT